MAAIESMNKHKIEKYALLIHDLEKKGIVSLFSFFCYLQLTIDAIKGCFGKIYRDLPDIKVRVIATLSKVLNTERPAARAAAPAGAAQSAGQHARRRCGVRAQQLPARSVGIDNLRDD